MKGIIYAVASVALIGVSMYGLTAHAHLIRKLVALNILGSGIFLLLIAVAQRTPAGVPDPVPQAMVLTGIVVAVSATAFGLALARRLYAATGQTSLDETSNDNAGEEQERWS
jgi:multicomponent Na+:H+ antiporter subunit C